MKKIAILTALLMLSSVSFAFAGAVDFDNAGKTIVSGDGKQIGKLSASVGLGSAIAATGYSITTQHLKGTRIFGTSHDSTAIYSKEVATVGSSGGTVTTSDSSAFGGWTQM